MAERAQMELSTGLPIPIHCGSGNPLERGRERVGSLVLFSIDSGGKLDEMSANPSGQSAQVDRPANETSGGGAPRNIGALSS